MRSASRAADYSRDPDETKAILVDPLSLIFALGILDFLNLIS
jgi:hypothetical protein